MKKIISLFLAITLLLPIPATEAVSIKNTAPTTELWLKFPEWENFAKIKELSYLAKSWSYRYSSIAEESLKLLIASNYKGNEEFFSNLARQFMHFKETGNLPLSDIIVSIPHGYSINPFTDDNPSFSSIWQSLLDASFQINTNTKYRGMLGAIDEKIREISMKKCRELKDFNECDSDNVNNYLPSTQELYDEEIYFNGKSVAIKDLKDEFNYEIIGQKSSNRLDINAILWEKNKQIQEFQKLITHPYLKYYAPGNWNFSQIDDADKPIISPDNKISVPELDRQVHAHCIKLVKSSYDLNFYNDIVNFAIQNKNQPNAIDLEKFLKNYKAKTHLPNTHTCIREIPAPKIQSYQESWKIPENITNILSSYTQNNKNSQSYSLSYKKEFLGLEEVKKSLESGTLNSQNIFVKNNIVATENSMDNLQHSKCPSDNLIARTDCSKTFSLLQILLLWLSSYQADNDKYPENISVLHDYIKNINDIQEKFAYKNTKNGDGFEIIYIGETIWSRQNSTPTKDYLALIGDQKIPEIPEIFANIPNDDMAIFVKNPSEFWQLLSEKDSIFPKFEDFLSSESIKNFIKKFFITQNFEEISQNVKNPFAIVVENLDISAPELIMIFNKNERSFFENKNFFIKEKWNFIFIGKSEKVLENFLKKIENNTLKSSGDFQYVWTKKSEKIQWAFVFVGDKFFEKMISLENFVLHFRKLNDVKEFFAVQKEFWAYENAFWKPVNTVKELRTIPTNSENLYSIENNILKHKNLGNFQNILPITENNYSLEQISRDELDIYKNSVWEYREVWQASLDPMGIVLNTKNNGIEIDFFMTPIPDIPGAFGEMVSNFKNISRETLDFNKNIRIKDWLWSFNIGFDEKKLQKIIENERMINMMYSEFSGEVLWWKSIFEYLKWEIWFFINDIEDDIFVIDNTETINEENIDWEKIHAGVAIGLQSNEKWEELISLLSQRAMEFSRESDYQKDLFEKIFNPKIETHNGVKIHSINIETPFFYKTTNFYYAFLNDFFIISTDFETLKKIINENKNPWKSSDHFEKNRLLSLNVNGKNVEKNFWNIFNKYRQKNKKNIDMALRELADDFGFTDLNEYLGKYFALNVLKEKIWEGFSDFSYQVGDIKIFSKNKEFFIQTDIEKLKTRIKENSDASNEKEIDEFFKRYESLFSHFQNWVTIDNEKINNDDIGVVFAYNGLLWILESLQNNNILKNLSFNFILTSDEIGFHLEYSDKNHENSNKDFFDGIFPKDENYKNIIFATIIWLLFLIWWIIVFVNIRKNKQNPSS